MKKIRIYFKGTNNFKEYITNGSIKDTKYKFIIDEYNLKEAPVCEVIEKCKKIFPYLTGKIISKECSIWY